MQQQPFTVDDLSKAEWCIRKINDKQSQLTSLKHAADNMKILYSQQVDDWLSKESSDLQQDIDSLSNILRPFVELQLQTSKNRSLKLPSGTVGFRKGNFSFSIDGEKCDSKSENLLKLFKSHNLFKFIVINESVDWTNFKKSVLVDDNCRVVTADGEFLDKLIAVREPDSFYVKSNANN